MLKLIRKHIYVFQPPITLNLADLGIVTSYKLKHNDKVLNVLLITNMIILLDFYVLFYLE